MLWFDESFANLGTQEKVRDTVTGWLQDAWIDSIGWIKDTKPQIHDLFDFSLFDIHDILFDICFHILSHYGSQPVAKGCISCFPNA